VSGLQHFHRLTSSAIFRPTAIAGWSPHLAWAAPAAAPAGPSPERLKATSLALAAARQSIDKLTAEISKLAASPEKKARASRRGQDTRG